MAASSCRFDVYLSFGWEDNEKGFVSLLHARLKLAGIRTFLGGSRRSYLGAVEDSRGAIVVISRSYASSYRCLEELVEIMELKKRLPQFFVLPIFYEVEPSDVRELGRSFAGALRVLRGNKFKDDPKKVQRWSNAMTEMASSKGFCTRNWETETELIERIVSYTSDILGYKSSRDINDLVGMEDCMQDLESLLHKDWPYMHGRIGIWGAKGIGKTTIARCFYNWHMHRFQAHCFIEVTRKPHKLALQDYVLFKIFQGNELRIREPCSTSIKAKLRRLKVLVVFDNVDKLSQLEVFAGISDWFGFGSIIIITTRDRDLLVAHGVENLYIPKCFRLGEALQVFCQYAFGQRQPKDEFEAMSFKVASYFFRIPLALKLSGSYLRGRSKEEWERELRRLSEKEVFSYENDIMKVWEDIFYGLSEECQSIFLHVACVFHLELYDNLKIIMDACGYHTESSIQILIEMCLIEMPSSDKLSIREMLPLKVRCMHDWLQQMGREIVRQQSICEPGERRFLMDDSDICDVLMDSTGTEAIEGIYLDFCEIDKLIVVNDDAFEWMPNLKFLIFRGAEDVDAYLEMLFPTGLSYLPRELRLLRWWFYPLQSLPSRFCPEFLVVLEMPWSKLQKLWDGIQPLGNLRKINLENSRHLKELPDLSRAINLEEISLSWCTSLVQVHASVETLRCLKFLSLRGCHCLECIPKMPSQCYILEPEKIATELLSYSGH